MASAQIAIPFGATAVDLLANLSHAGDVTVGDTVVLFNSGTVTVLLGDSGVASGTGFRALTAGAVLSLDLKSGDTLYGLVPTGSTNGAVDVLRVA